jgi:pSer/pThr/pTyr-binding forkhead associated (FHA) protein
MATRYEPVPVRAGGASGGVDGSSRSTTVEETTFVDGDDSVADGARRASSAHRWKDGRMDSDDAVAPDDGRPAEDVDATVVGRPDDTVLRAESSTAGPARAGRHQQVAPRRWSRVRVGADEHRLDRPVVVGRRPTAPRVVIGTPPSLVAVPSPTRSVSSSHVEVRQDGQVVVVTDLRSTNGTIVRSPGRVPVKLRQGESTVALPGTIVDVGDGNTLEVLAPIRSTVQEETHT